MADNQPNRPQDAPDRSIIGRDAQEAQQQAGIAGEPQPGTDRPDFEEGNLEVEFISEIHEDGGEA
jgi:hypothetical protein